MQTSNYNVLICSYLEPEYVERIREVDARLNVIHEPELLRLPRYAADHTGDPNLNRTPEQEKRWRELLAQADILFDFDPTHRADLPDLAPNVHWIQSTSAGIGQFVKRNGYDTRMPNTIFTTASGVHARPLAEFCLMAILMHNKGAARMQRDQQCKHWERYASTDLENRTLGLVGLGRVGSEVARLAKAVGMQTIGTDLRAVSGVVDRFFPVADLHQMLPLAEYLVVIVPHTPETENMIGAAELALLPKGAYFINIARGAAVDEPALIEALRSGHLSGAALDVFAVEPLPLESPLWEMPNVLVSPHSASTSDHENQRITDLFCDNLRRYLAGAPLRNVLDTRLMY
jgi:phosphoglycerate dehydrogenase-like enzyme